MKRAVALAAAITLLWSCPAAAHDASAWGGLFRSRDHGVTWFLVSPGTYPTAAIALAVSPADANHLLLATDSGVLRSRNGGRDWVRQAPDLLAGAIFAVTFAVDGQRALVSTATGLFASDAADGWRPVRSPPGAVPARALVSGQASGRAYIAGWAGFARTDDWGTSWSEADHGLPRAPVTALVVEAGRPETIRVVVGGELWSSRDEARSWIRPGTPGLEIEAVALDGARPGRLWGARAAGLVHSDDGGASWQRVGQPLPEPKTSVRGLSAIGPTVALTTDRGIFRTTDMGEHWLAVLDNLPAHIEAGPLVNDPTDPVTLYAGFAATPYAELWNRAVDTLGALRRIDVGNALAAAAFLIALTLVAIGALHRLRRYYQRPLTLGSRER